MRDVYAERSYGAHKIGFGERPGVVVVDFQTGFTDPQYPLGGAPLIERAVQNTARVLDVARRHGFPVASCYTAYTSQRDMPYWKVGATREQFIHGHPCTRLDPRIHDPAYDVVVCKPGASIFFHTPVVSYFTKERVDTVIVTGCVTSGCIRASVIDSFQHYFRTIVPEDCVGDYDEGPHNDNLRDVNRRYCDLSNSDEVIVFLEDAAKRARLV
jgi:maleamate amidohydrolase